MKISLIAAIGKNNELGYKNNLIWHIPNDLKYFKKMTEGKTVVMGRNTYNSIGKALPKRKNIVLTTNDLNDSDIKVIHDYKEIFNLPDEEIFIIGGESIYKLFIDYADDIYLTIINKDFELADSYFPSFDKEKYIYEEIKEEEYNDLSYKYTRYRKR